MSRIEFVFGLDKEVRERFIDNLIQLNGHGFAEYWMNGEPTAGGISGAFPWIYSEEGHNYWNEINNKSKLCI